MTDHVSWDMLEAEQEALARMPEVVELHHLEGTSMWATSHDAALRAASALVASGIRTDPVVISSAAVARSSITALDLERGRAQLAPRDEAQRA